VQSFVNAVDSFMKKPATSAPSAAPGASQSPNGKELMLSFLEQMNHSSAVHFLGESTSLFVEWITLLHNESVDALVRSAKAQLLGLSAGAYCGGLHAVLERLRDSLRVGKSWKARQACLQFLQLFAFLNAFLFSNGEDNEEDGLYALLLELLQDEHIEVRESASRALGVFLRVAPEERQRKFLGSFGDWSATRLPKSPISLASRPAVSVSFSSAEATRRHAGVLGLCAVVLSHPHDIPSWMVAVIVLLAGHVNDPAPINSSVRLTFREFWRTQQDTWHIFKQLFDEDQRVMLTELLISPSYYA
jgi:proteasome activator subunit 4